MRLAIEVNVIAIYSLANQLPQRTGTGGLNGTRPRPTTISFRLSPSAAALQPAAPILNRPWFSDIEKFPHIQNLPEWRRKKKQTTHFASQSLNYVYESIRSVPPREPSIRFFEQLGSHRRRGVASRRSLEDDITVFCSQAQALKHLFLSSLSRYISTYKYVSV